MVVHRIPIFVAYSKSCVLVLSKTFSMTGKCSTSNSGDLKHPFLYLCCTSHLPNGKSTTRNQQDNPKNQGPELPTVPTGPPATESQSRSIRLAAVETRIARFWMHNLSNLAEAPRFGAHTRRCKGLIPLLRRLVTVANVVARDF